MPSEPYDSFEYLQPADFVTPLQQGYDEINRGFERAEEMAKVNDRQRMENAKLFGRAINQMQTIAPKLANAWKIQEEKQDKIYRTENLLLARESGATWNDLQAYVKRNKDKENYQGDVGYYEQLAAKLEADGSIEGRDTARELRSLTGNKAVIFKEILVGNQARNFSADFKTSNFQTREYKRADGTPLSYANAESAEELRIVLREYHKFIGLNSIDDAGLSTEFLDEKYWPAITKQEDTIISTWSDVKFNQDQVERKDLVTKQLLSVAGDANIGEKYLELVRNNPTLFKAGAKSGVLDEAFLLYETGKLSDQDLINIHEYQFTPDDWKKQGRTDTISIGKHFDPQFSNFTDRLNAARTKRFQNIQTERTNTALELAEGLRQKVDSRGFPLTETEYVQAKKRLNDLGIYALPAQFTVLGENTLQDQEDNALIAKFESDSSLGIPISRNDIMKIQNSTLRATWLKNESALSGIPGIDRHHKSIDAFTDDALGRLTGDSTKTHEWYVINYKLKNKFNEFYRLAVENAPPTEAGRQAAAVEALKLTQQYLEANKDSSTFGQYEQTSLIDDFSINQKKAIDALDSAKKRGEASTYPETTIIPGTEDALKKLEKWRPGQPLPPIYTSIALAYKRSPDGLPATKWKIAAAQYKLATGKDLPKDKDQLNLESLSDTNQYIINYRRTNQRVRQAQIQTKAEQENTEKEDNKKEDIWNRVDYTIFGPGAYSAPATP